MSMGQRIVWILCFRGGSNFLPLSGIRVRTSARREFIPSLIFYQVSYHGYDSIILFYEDTPRQVAGYLF